MATSECGVVLPGAMAAPRRGPFTLSQCDYYSGLSLEHLDLAKFDPADLMVHTHS